MRTRTRSALLALTLSSLFGLSCSDGGGDPSPIGTTTPGTTETPPVPDTPRPTQPLNTPTPGPGVTPTAQPGTATPGAGTATPGTDTPSDVDNDQDGFTDLDGDCDDFDNDVYPGAPEVPYNGDDEDCSGEDLTDVDRDGHDAEQAGGDDCNDNDGTVYPGATEVPDGEDNDCDGEVDDNIDDKDDDGDGYAESDGDCDDTNPAKNPGAEEVPYNGVDEDCSGVDLDDVDGDGSTGGAEGFDCNDDDASILPGADEVPYDGIDQDCSGEDLVDVDGDGSPGSGSGELDCDDTDPDRAPTLTEIAYDGIDNNCDGVDTTDVDGDGFDSEVVGGEDCNDGDAAINPNAEDIAYNGIDEDCSGEDLADVDGDGYDAEVAGGDDCNDEDVNTYPDANEIGDGKDNDCDGEVDEALDNVDNDGDGVSELDGDCNDGDAQIYPGATEIPNDGIDQDCSGLDVTDGDGDGFNLGSDCDDEDPAINPDADEIPYDGIDQDCSGGDKVDVDGDGFAATQAGGDDCNDTSALVNPDGIEKPYDGIDQDCSGADLADVDNDGFDATAVSGGTDCNDTNAAINPGSDELCDSIDNNCDNVVDTDAVDRDTYYTDGDHDGYGDPNAPVKACTPSGSLVEDNTDCDDTSAASYPGGSEVCDSHDNDCDGQVDEGLLSTYYQDADADGYGNANKPVQACSPPQGYVTDKTDCKDTNDSVHPGATELCDGVDQDCDGLIDEDARVTFYRDNDKDLYGDVAVTTQGCTPPSGYVSDKTDCNDNNAAINPGALEVCDSANVDENCNGLADNNDSTTQSLGKTPYYIDGDKDGYGNSATAAIPYCDNPSTSSLSYATNNGDCNDSNAAINPGASEVCDPGNNDENCNGTADDADPGTSTSGKSTWYPDGDKDGYGGSTSSGTTYCDNPSTSSSSFVTNKSDCNDTNAAINPAASEICDVANVDENCNGTADDSDSTTSASTKTSWYLDGDKDGYGNSSSTATVACDNPSTPSNTYVTNNSDCNDANALVSPGATEICDTNNVDENCNGAADDNDTTTSTGSKTTWYPDADKDGYGNSASSGTSSCENPSTTTSVFVTNKQDCNDTNVAINPAATEICDVANVDENCNGFADDNDGTTSTASKGNWYPDVDKDGYGNSTSSATVLCDNPSTTTNIYVTNKTDCNDSNAAINPGATEFCDSANVDENCNGVADDADNTTSSGSKTTWYPDGDKDGYGNSASSGSVLCDNPSTTSNLFVTNKSDCNDTNAAINPAAAEVCDSANVDENCNGAADDNDTTTTSGGKTTWYPDGDKDGYGNISSSGTLLCDNPSTSSSVFVANKTDCNDSNAAINPGASEACNGVDDNCNGVADEGGGGVTGSSTFNYTGSEQVFTVPLCVGQVTITAFGAEGVRATTSGGAVAGKGGMASGKLTVTGGQTLYVYVGGQNGYNGGAAGWSGSSMPCNGGGASDVRVGNNAITSRVIVAGGGGGVSGETNWGNGGNGGGGTCGTNYCGGGGASGYYQVAAGSGGNTGGSGTSSCHGGSGGGGGLTSGGGGATSTCYGGATGGTGTLGFGGVGASTTSGCCQLYGVAGGGGGYYGGGGSAGGCCGGGGAGGGSSWTGTLSSPTFTAGARAGNGVVVISW